MLAIDLSKDSAKFLERVPPKHGRQLALRLTQLRASPFPNDSKALKGAADLRRADSGEYRIIYHLEEDTLKVDLIGKGKDDEVYRRLRRK